MIPVKIFPYHEAGKWPPAILWISKQSKLMLKVFLFNAYYNIQTSDFAGFYGYLFRITDMYDLGYAHKKERVN